MEVPAFLKVKDESVYYNGKGEILLFIPEAYFDKKCAVIEGEYVSVIGILDYAIRPDITKPISPSSVKRFYFPTTFVTKPGKIEKKKDFQLTKDCVADYRILHYTNNDVDQVIVSTRVPQDIQNTEYVFTVLMTTPSIPKTIKYHDIYKYFIDNAPLAGFSYGMNAQLFGVIVSELYRDPDNINKPFRLGKNIDKNPYSYIPVSVKEIPKLVSPFTSITSENFNEAIVSAIMNDNDEEIPLERVLMG